MICVYRSSMPQESLVRSDPIVALLKPSVLKTPKNESRSIFGASEWMTATSTSSANSSIRNVASGDPSATKKPTAFIINTCRGPTIDEQALIKALQRGELAGAGLDVFEVEPTPADNPLLSMDNVMVTPHSAGGSVASRDAAPIQIGQEAARLLNGKWPMSLVNPQVRAQIPTRTPATSV